MPEKIGKYEVIERIGRGGMGLVLKARDPLLDRAVALKVISTDIDITDELRTRFFREAQACARLSHPNIVTVYDMGEHEGRLFMVMELLEGEELRRLITQRKPLPLEDKLSVMMQVCDGLHYAHTKGIVHRDIKPGNIMLLRSGQVKILDFGIAQIATTEGGLTRTGLIMGTLRYIAPEQVRGRADHRADIYSVGAVAYELLASRPPFTGDDPLHLLEQLRTEDPTPLVELDPTIPPELAAIVERAMRKQPGDRFQDLEEMRVELERLHRGFAEKAQQIRARVRSQQERLRQLQTTLAERIGVSSGEDTILTPDERARLSTLLSVETDLGHRIEALEAKVARANLLDEAMRHGAELLRGGHFGEAAIEFEAIVEEMPEHGPARELLGQARAQVEAQRVRELAARFVGEARNALADGDYTLCLEILKHTADVSVPTEMEEEIGALRDAAEAGRTVRAATRRLREQAEEARQGLAPGRARALAAGAPQDAAEQWGAAEASLAAAEAAFTRATFDSALTLFNETVSLYRRAEEAARESQRRRAQEARDRATQARQAAAAAGAEQDAATLWGEAAGRIADGEAALAHGQYARAMEAFQAAPLLYRRAEEAAREAQRGRADEARERAVHARQAAAATGAEQHAAALWNEAAGKIAEGEAALAQQQYARAVEAFEAGPLLYRRAEEAARGGQRRRVERVRQRAVQSQQAAAAMGAEQHAAALWNEAVARMADGDAAFAREEYARAIDVFEAAPALYQTAEGAARDKLRRMVKEARARAAEAREAAAATGAERHAAPLWNEGSGTIADGEAALAQEQYARALDAFEAAPALYRRAAEEAGEARRRQREQAEQKRQTMLERRQAALAASSPSHTGPGWAEAEACADSGETALNQEDYAEAIRAFDQAAGLYGRAEEQGRAAARALETARAEAEKARRAAGLARRAAARVEASQYAPQPWQAGERCGAEADAALGRQDFEGARALFAEARHHHVEAAQAAGVAAEAEARRVDAMMRTAKQLLESGDAAGSLRRLNEILVLKPGHAPADRLRLDAERALLQRGEAVPREPVADPAERGAEDADPEMTILRPADLRPTEPIRPAAVIAAPPAAAPPAVAPPAPVAHAHEQSDPEMTMLVRPPATPVHAPAPVAEPPAVAAAPPSTIDAGPGASTGTVHEGSPVAKAASEEATIVAAPVAHRVAPRAPAAAGPGEIGYTRPQARQAPPAPPRAKRSPWPLVIAGVGGLGVIALGLFMWLPTRSGSAPPAGQVVATGVPRAGGPAAVAPPTSAKAPGDPGKPMAPPDVPAEEPKGPTGRGAARIPGMESQVAEARRTAELAGAPSLAPILWARAEAMQQKAEDAIKTQAFEKAPALFFDAERGYRAAEKAALEKGGADKRAADRAAADRAAADKAAADRAAAAEKAAADRAAAEKAAADKAAADRAAAAEKAAADRAAAEKAAADKAAADRLLALRQEQRTTADESRGRAASRREQAVKVEAHRLAKDLFDAADARLADADGQARSQNYTAASRAYQDAGERYVESGLRAQARAHADSARSRMIAEKQRARQDSSEFRAALVEERQGNALYEQFHYREAVARFEAAESLFVKAAAQVSTPPPPKEPEAPRPPAPRPRRPVPAGPG